MCSPFELRAKARGSAFSSPRSGRGLQLQGTLRAVGRCYAPRVDRKIAASLAGSSVDRHATSRSWPNISATYVRVKLSGSSRMPNTSAFPRSLNRAPADLEVQEQQHPALFRERDITTRPARARRSARIAAIGPSHNGAAKTFLSCRSFDRCAPSWSPLR